MPIMLAIAGIIGLLTLLGLSASTFNSSLIVDMRTEPQQGSLVVGETFEVAIVVESSIPVNVFAGELIFNNQVLNIESIDYNTSIADLWAERPWYSNGDGTIIFAGGTTQSGGFVGTDSLLTVTFKAKDKGAGQIAIQNARILQHDGFGTDAPLVHHPVDALFTVDVKTTASDVLHKTDYGTSYIISEEKPSTDLNADGKQTIADVSIFMIHLASRNMHSDFNGDGKINTADLSILLQTK